MSREALEALPEISFIEDADSGSIMNRLVGWYQEKYAELTGENQTLLEAHPMKLILYACTMEFVQAYQYIDRAGKLNLLKYSYGGWLDNVGALRGVTRQQASAAKVTVRFSIDQALTSAVAIPQGTRVTNGEKYFYTEEYAEIAAGDTYKDVECACTDPGLSGNGLFPGEINTLVDTLPYITEVSNTTTSENGADIESDDAFAVRIFLVPNSYSVAGPEGAYEYWVRKYSQNIGDVKITSPSPTEVLARVLMIDGSTPSQSFLEGLETFLANREIRPLTDHVSAAAPTVTSADVDVTYYIRKSDQGKAAIIQNDVASAVDEYITWQSGKIGRDLNPSELILKMMSAGAKRVIVHEPAYQQTADSEVVNIASKTITYGGLEDD